MMSVVATFFPQVVGGITFYDTTALIVTLIFLGKYLEVRAKGQTNEAIKKLIGLQARTAHVVRSGQEVELPIEQVRVGDELVVRPGEKIPVDGVVVHEPGVWPRHLLERGGVAAYDSIQAAARWLRAGLHLSLLQRHPSPGVGHG